MSPTLFNIYLEEIISNVFKCNGGIVIGGRMIKCIPFADDIVVTAESEPQLNDMHKISRVNIEKRKLTRIKLNELYQVKENIENIAVKIRTKVIEQVDLNTYGAS